MAKKKSNMIYDHDKWLTPYKDVIDRRHKMIMELKDRFSVDGSLSKGINNHVYYGLHRDDKGSWVFREFAPNANKIYLIGDFNNWNAYEGEMYPVETSGIIDIKLTSDIKARL